jgi:hypothetical protein
MHGSEYASIEAELVTLFERLVAELPPNAASLEVKRVGRNKEGVLVTLRPQNPDAASMWAHAENCLHLVDFGFGDWEPTWELPIEGYNRKADKREVLKEVEELCKAVMAGNCKHTRGLFSVTGSIQAGGRPYKITEMLVFRRKPPFHGTRIYEPYISGL